MNEFRSRAPCELSESGRKRIKEYIHYIDERKFTDRRRPISSFSQIPWLLRYVNLISLLKQKEKGHMGKPERKLKNTKKKRSRRKTDKNLWLTWEFYIPKVSRTWKFITVYFDWRVISLFTTSNFPYVESLIRWLFLDKRIRVHDQDQ